jgi:hypothetical protein
VTQPASIEAYGVAVSGAVVTAMHQTCLQALCLLLCSTAALDAHSLEPKGADGGLTLNAVGISIFELYYNADVAIVDVGFGTCRQPWIRDHVHSSNSLCRACQCSLVQGILAAQSAAIGMP